MIYCFTVLFLLLISFFIQEFIPVFAWAYYSRLLFVHAVFFSAAVSVPFPVMLVFAFISGFIWDCRYHIPIQSMEGGLNSPVEIPFGFTIFVFGLLGAFIQGVRPFFRLGRWELPVLMVGVCTLGSLLLEYLMICFHRGGIVTSVEFWWKILMTALYSTLLAPFLLLLFSRLAALTGFKIHMDGITRRYSYDGDPI
jgi:cell shape-determining protein MreD